MKKSFLIVMALLLSTYSFAQVPIEQNKDLITFDIKLDSLHPQYQAHGFLRERCVEFTDLDNYNGESLNDSNYVTQSVFTDLLRSAATLPRIPVDNLAEEVLLYQTNANASGKCPIAIAQYTYKQFKENALEDNMVKIEDGYIKDIYLSGNLQDPYEDKLLFAFAPSDTLFDNQVEFSFPSEIWKRNFGATVEFDLDDGKGYRKINTGSSITVNYSTGKHCLKMRTYFDNKYFYSHSVIKTLSFAAEATTRAFNYGYYSEEITCENGASAKLWRENDIDYKTNINPFVIVEGFDPVRYGNNAVLESQNYGKLGPKDFIDNNLSYLIKSNYDIFYLDFQDCKLSIKTNSQLLQKTLDQIKGYNLSNNPVIVMGSSMGGLIARYCLRKMELDGLRHGVSTLICQDTPNLGANVPLGYLYSAHSLIDIYNRYVSRFKDIKDPLSYLRDIIHCQAAKEMLYNYVNEQGVIDNTEHESFLSEMSFIGYPHGDDGMLRCIAISNGNNQIVNPTRSLFNCTGYISTSSLADVLTSLIQPLAGVSLGYITQDWGVGLLGILPGSNKLRCQAIINPTGSGKNICNISLTYKKNILGFIKAQRTFYEYTRPDPSNVISYDIVNGSYYDINNLDIDVRNQEFANELINYGLNVKYLPHFLFIPIASSLDIGEGKISLTQSDYMTRYEMTNRTPYPKHSPFHAYYIPKQSESHIAMNDGASRWLIDQFKTFIEGDIIASETQPSIYHLRNIPTGNSVEWSTSSPDIATINNMEVLTPKGSGYIDIIAILSNGQKFTKRVRVGLPKCVASAESQSNYCRANLNVLDLQSDYRMISPYIKCDVGIKFGTQPFIWKECPNQYYDISKTENGGRATIYFRLKYINSENQEIIGNPIYISLSTAYPYILEPNYFKYYSDGTFDTIVLKRNPYYTDEFTDDLKIYYFESHGGDATGKLPGVSEMTLSVENIFSSAQIDNLCNNFNIHSMSNDFVIRDPKGKIIQHFNVSMVKP